MSREYAREVVLKIADAVAGGEVVSVETAQPISLVSSGLLLFVSLHMEAAAERPRYALSSPTRLL